MGRVRRPLPSGRGGKAIAIALAVGAIALVAVWAVPNMAGRVFVQVRAVATARTATSGPSLAIAGSPAVRAAAIEISIDVENRYPLSVVLGAGPMAFRAAAYRRDASGRLNRVWGVGVGDATAEEGSDSPVGGGSAGGAFVVSSGVTRHSIANGSSAFGLVDATGASLPAGVYYLRVWAYGIGSALVPLSLDGGTDPLGPPTDLPAAN